MQTVKPFFIKVVTPLHTGSGSDLGVVDMPIQRESHTSFPKIEASSLKGSIRSEFTSNHSEEDAEKIFGTGDEAGKLGFSDARILFFPVKSVKGVFAYITCPMVIDRLIEDLSIKNRFDKIEKVEKNTIPETTKNKLLIDNKAILVLEEYQFEVKECVKTKKMAEYLSKELEIDELKDRVVVLDDDDFKDFVTLSTEIITRIKIDNETGTVDKKTGALFTEEYLPTETIMYALALGVVAEIKDINTLQVGGNSTLGKGIIELKGLSDVN